ncbi:hypothetical protein SAMN05216599_10471 [Pseudomonas cichorii]|nr:hypothetical protein SAMN05216599_10471 [Pseudomonas cichorii]
MRRFERLWRWRFPDGSARVLGALDCEFSFIPAVMATLDEIEGMFE